MVVHNDYFLERAVTDKPPSTYAVVGTSLLWIGENEFAARLPNVYFSLLGLAAFYAFVRQATHSQSTAIVALFFLIISPLDIAYAATVFQDPPMLACALLSAWFISRQNWALAGLSFGFSVIMKPTGLWLLPLIVGIGMVCPARQRSISVGIVLSRTVFFIVFSTLPVALVYWWDAQRPQSFISLGASNNNPQRWIRSDEVWMRAETWLQTAGQITGAPAVGIILALLSVVWLLHAASKRHPTGLVSWLVTVYLIAYAGIYWFIAFSIWNRYVFLLTPFLLLIAAQAVVWLAGKRQSILVLMISFIVVANWQHIQSADRLSRAPGVKGVDELADVLNHHFYGAIVYDYWFGWSLSWYLGGAPGVWVIYFPTPESLATHMQQGDGAQYFIAPSEAQGRIWQTLLNGQQVQTIPLCRTREGGFVIYQLLPANIVIRDELPTDIPPPAFIPYECPKR